MPDKRRTVLICIMLANFACGASAQDVRGLEVCTAEKQIDRRTSCLQSNVEFLQISLNKATREAQERLAAAGREIAAQKAEIIALKSDLAKIHAELAELRKAGAGKK